MKTRRSFLSFLGTSVAAISSGSIQLLIPEEKKVLTLEKAEQEWMDVNLSMFAHLALGKVEAFKFKGEYIPATEAFLCTVEEKYIGIQTVQSMYPKSNGSFHCATDRSFYFFVEHENGKIKRMNCFCHSGFAFAPLFNFHFKDFIAGYESNVSATDVQYRLKPETNNFLVI